MTRDEANRRARRYFNLAERWRYRADGHAVAGRWNRYLHAMYRFRMYMRISNRYSQSLTPGRESRFILWV